MKKLNAIQKNSLRDLISEANELGLLKDDIVQIIPDIRESSSETRFFMIFEEDV